MIGRVNTGGGGAGGTLTVTTPGAGITVTVSKDGKTKTKVSGADGVAAFKGLATGTWTLTITDGTQTASKPVVVTADYNTTISFFSATINVTYPAGSTCTATDGVTTLTAPDTSGTWDCVVANAGTWTVSLDNDLEETVEVTESGATYTVSKWYVLKGGDVRENITGGWSSNGNLTATVESDGIRISNDGDYGVCGTNSKVPIKGFHTLYLSYSNNTFNNMQLIIDTDKPPTYDGSYVAITEPSVTGTESGTIELDISGAHSYDKLYIGFSGGWERGISTLVTGIWVEA